MLNLEHKRPFPRAVLRAFLLAVGFVVSAVAGGASAADDTRSLQDDATAFFKWWDEIGLPDLKDSPFVRYRPGWGRAAGGPGDGWDQGFLLSETDRDFTVLGTDLWTRSWEKPRGGETANSAGFERADLAATVDAGVALLASPQPQNRIVDPFVFEREYWQKATYRLLVLARACAARGLRGQALSLLPLATAGNGASDSDDRLSRWKKLIRYGALLAANGRLGDPGATWSDIRREFARWASGPDVSDRAVEAAALIDRTVAREASDAAREVSARCGSNPDTVADLITALRVPGGAELMDPDLARVTGHSPTSAAERLRALGDAAVPHLIEALDDDTYVRHVSSFQGRFHREMQVDRMRDVALAILDDISGHALDKARMTAKVTRGDWAEVVAEAKRWWSARRAQHGSPVDGRK
ncbi:MAG: hypothetical protein U1E39_00335 [Planctomycetota bacterium]